MNIPNAALTTEDLNALDGFWRASNYLAAAMIYLRANPLLREPLQRGHLKNRLLGHWGSSPGLSFIYTHLNRVICEQGIEALFVAGPGHGAPGVLGPVYLEGTYGRFIPECTDDVNGLQHLMRQFSAPGGVGSHCTPELPGSIHEGGELGYSLSHAVGAAMDNPELIVACVVGDGEAETGPLATSWHGSKFLNPVRDGAVLPILHLNGYKISGPTIFSRIASDELLAFIRGNGWTPHLVEGRDPTTMHAAMAAALDRCIAEINRIRQHARSTGDLTRPHWPMIVLRTPKGWTGPSASHGHQIEGSWRAHQVPLTSVTTDAEQFVQLEKWLRGYRPDELFDDHGRLRDSYRRFIPAADKTMSASTHANGGGTLHPLKLPTTKNYEVSFERPGLTSVENTVPLATWMAEIFRQNPDTFRLFCPDETSSNRLQAVFEATNRMWLEPLLALDSDDGHLAPDGRVFEMLSEHTLEGWLEGYLLTGRHGVLSTYEAFAHIIDSMVNQHCKWLESSIKIPWRLPVPSLNLLITSTVWRQDHNGFTHQDPGFMDVVANKSPMVTRIYLPPDANSLLSVAEHCLKSTDLVNVIVVDKQRHLQFLTIDEANEHCRRGASVWHWASTDHGVEPDVVLACAGDVATMETLAASEILRREFPDIAIRFVNVVDLFAMANFGEHPHTMSDPDYVQLFTNDRPIIFNFHGYPWLIHRLSYRRPNHDNMHVRGYKEQGSINTPMQLAIENEVDRFSIALDTIKRVPRLTTIGAGAAERIRTLQAAAVRHANEFGIDSVELSGWTWPGNVPFRPATP